MLFHNDMVAARRIVITHDVMMDIIEGCPEELEIFKYFVKNKVQICAPSSIEKFLHKKMMELSDGFDLSYQFYENRWDICRGSIIFPDIDDLKFLYNRMHEFVYDPKYNDYVLMAVRYKVDFIWMKGWQPWIDTKVAKTVRSESLIYDWHAYNKEIQKKEILKQQEMEKRKLQEIEKRKQEELKRLEPKRIFANSQGDLKDKKNKNTARSLETATNDLFNDEVVKNYLEELKKSEKKKETSDDLLSEIHEFKKIIAENLFEIAFGPKSAENIKISVENEEKTIIKKKDYPEENSNNIDDYRLNYYFYSYMKKQTSKIKENNGKGKEKDAQQESANKNNIEELKGIFNNKLKSIFLEDFKKIELTLLEKCRDFNKILKMKKKGKNTEESELNIVDQIKKSTSELNCPDKIKETINQEIQSIITNWNSFLEEISINAEVKKHFWNSTKNPNDNVIYNVLNFLFKLEKEETTKDKLTIKQKESRKKQLKLKLNKEIEDFIGNLNKNINKKFNKKAILAILNNFYLAWKFGEGWTEIRKSLDGFITESFNSLAKIANIFDNTNKGLPCLCLTQKKEEKEEVHKNIKYVFLEEIKKNFNEHRNDLRYYEFSNSSVFNDNAGNATTICNCMVSEYEDTYLSEIQEDTITKLFVDDSETGDKTPFPDWNITTNYTIFNGEKPEDPTPISGDSSGSLKYGGETDNIETRDEFFKELKKKTEEELAGKSYSEKISDNEPADLPIDAINIDASDTFDKIAQNLNQLLAARNQDVNKKIETIHQEKFVKDELKLEYEDKDKEEIFNFLKSCDSMLRIGDHFYNTTALYDYLFNQGYHNINKYHVLKMKPEPSKQSTQGVAVVKKDSRRKLQKIHQKKKKYNKRHLILENSTDTNQPNDGRDSPEESNTDDIQETNQEYLKNFLPFDPTNWLKLHVLNVGQGDCLILEFPRNKEESPFVIVIDHKGKNVDLARGYLEDFIGFKKNKEGSPMVFVVSHAHYDHIQKAVEFIEYFRPLEMWISPFIRYFTSSYYKLIAAATRNRIPIFTLTEGTQIKLINYLGEKLGKSADDPINNVKIKVLGPSKTQFKNQDLEFTWDRPINKDAVRKARTALNKLNLNAKEKKLPLEERKDIEESKKPRYEKILTDLKVPNPKNSPYRESYKKMDGLINALEGAVENLGDVINNSSIVLELTYCKRTVLLTGDAEFDEWKTILTHYWLKKDDYQKKNNKVQIDIFKVPHHGGKCGGYLEDPFKKGEIKKKKFNDILTSKFAVISVGPHKKYQHPKKEVIQSFKEKTIIELKDASLDEYRLYRTDDLSMTPYSPVDYNDLNADNFKDKVIFSYIFGIIPQIKGKKIETEKKAIVYPYRVMIKEKQYKQIT